MLRRLLFQVIVVTALLAVASGQLVLVDSAGDPLRTVSPSLFDSNNVAHVLAPGVFEDLYPNTVLTKYDERFYPLDSARYQQAIIHAGDNGTIFGPEFPGLYTLVWSNAAQDQSYYLQVEVTCDDGIHCNGQERYIRGECVPGYVPYVFGPNGEEVHDCYEGFPWAEREAQSYENACGPICQPQCNQGRKCGSGGCPICTAPDTPLGCTWDADFCGSCDVSANETCIDGQCVVAPPPSNTPGTCYNSYPLFANPRSSFYLPGNGGTDVHIGDSYLVPAGAFQGRLVVSDVTGAEHNLQPYCNSVESSPEFVFEFEIDGPRGFEIMMTGIDGLDVYNGYSGTTDTLVAVHYAADRDCESFRLTGADYLCSDDATPPGSLGSRASGLLPAAGRYTIIASTYAPGAWGPFILWVKFSEDATRPTCDASFCGTDSASSTCGFTGYLGIAECDLATDSCILGRCSNCDPAYVNSSAYTSECQGKQCGVDQCNLLCGKTGSCPGKRECDELNKKCKPITPCDPFAPDCSGEQKGRGPTKYCGTDCQWYRADDPLPDLIAPLEYEVKNSITFAYKSFTPEHCGVAEGTVNPPAGIIPGETFSRPLMFFDTNAHNLGESFIPPPFEKRPDMFQWGDCHGHMHFSQFARFLLRNGDGSVASDERLTKLAYCMEDSEPWLAGDYIPCAGTRSCDAQGLTRGFSDYYPADLDGQWIDLANPDLPVTAGWHLYEVEVNFGRIIHERAFDNNINKFWVFVDPSLVSGNPIDYPTMLALGNGCAQLPAGVSVPECA